MTPVASHLVEAGRSYTFTLELAGYMPAKVDAQVGAGEREVPVHAALASGGELVMSGNVPARATVSNSKACAAGRCRSTARSRTGATRWRSTTPIPSSPRRST